MKWPWTSVARLDDAQREIAWLRTCVSDLQDRLDRRTRAEIGLPEQPRQPRDKMEQMPSELLQEIRKYGSRAIQNEQIRQAKRRRLAGESWEDIMADVIGDRE